MGTVHLHALLAIYIETRSGESIFEFMKPEHSLQPKNAAENTLEKNHTICINNSSRRPTA